MHSTITNFAYGIEWRHREEKRWIPTIACGFHLKVLQGRTPIRVSGKTYPVDSCVLCIAAKRARERLALEQRIKGSPIGDGICQSRLNQKLLKPA